MFHTIDEFLETWREESGKSAAQMRALTDASLGAAVVDEHRTLGRVAWHLVQTLREMPAHAGLSVSGPGADEPVPPSAAAIAEAYEQAARSLADAVRFAWTDETLEVEDEMYGERWTRSKTLTALVFHEVHHRGQMTVLMRKAGLRVPGVYGPSREEWSGIGMEPPAV